VRVLVHVGSLLLLLLLKMRSFFGVPLIIIVYDHSLKVSIQRTMNTLFQTIIMKLIRILLEICKGVWLYDLEWSDEAGWVCHSTAIFYLVWAFACRTRMRWFFIVLDFLGTGNVIHAPVLVMEIVMKIGKLTFFYIKIDANLDCPKFTFDHWGIVVEVKKLTVQKKLKNQQQE